MILPSIDLRGGNAVQLRSGKQLVVDAGDPLPWLERFARVGEVAVVDLDAAFGEGDHRELIAAMCRRAPCRVGGGIRDVQTARELLDAGATRVVLGTRAEPELLRQLPRERCVAALDADRGEVVVDGWRRGTGATVEQRMRELQPYVGGFLVTFVETEGSLQGIDVERARALRAAAGDAKLVVAGGVANADEVAALDRLGIDVQVGMALYTDRFDEADALAAMLPAAEPWPTVVVDELGDSLGLVWSDRESLKAALREGRGVYHSRRRGLWRKGESSGDRQDLVRVELDCDRDALRFVVRQHGDGFCHLQRRSCWGDDQGLGALERRIRRAADRGDPASYTAKLLGDPAWLDAKLLEEAGELAAARGRDEIVHEAADLLYFLMVALRAGDVELADVVAELDRRARRVQRRGGAPKPAADATGGSR